MAIMRVGEIKAIVEKVTTPSDQIQLVQEPIYGGQAYIVKNFDQLVAALRILKLQKWNAVDFASVQEVLSRFRTIPASAQISAQDFNTISAYVNALNTSMPIFMGTLNTLAEDQAEQVINIKIDGTATTFKGLNELNTRLDDMLKLFIVDGKVEVEGFDKGTNWYIVLLTGGSTYHAFIAALDIAKRYFEVTKTYYESKKAKVDYEASLGDGDKPTETGRKKYAQKHLDLELRQEVEEAVDKIVNLNGHTQPELTTKLVKATKELIAVMGDGVEFHLSLNPPEYVRENANSLTIDYTKIPAPEKADGKELPPPTRSEK